MKGRSMERTITGRLHRLDQHASGVLFPRRLPELSLRQLRSRCQITGAGLRDKGSTQATSGGGVEGGNLVMIDGVAGFGDGR